MITVTLTPSRRRALLAALRERAGEFLQRIYRREVLVARAVRGFQLEAVDVFERDVVRPVLREIGAGLTEFSLRGQDVSPETHRDLAALIEEAEAIVEKGVDSIRKLTQDRAKKLAVDEAKFVASAAGREAEQRVPTAKTPDAAVRPWLGDNTERWFRKMLATPTGDAIRQRITIGVQQGKSTDQIVAIIRGTQAGETGVFDSSRRAVATLVRTAATSASARSRIDSFKAMGVDSWQFVATLDSRTSTQCAAHDGKVFAVGRGPLPPLHPNCRSAVVPWFGEPEGTRASADGQVPADLTFPKWLETRTVDEQDEVLGKTKADAWRNGKLTIADMLGRDLEPLTLAELRDLGRL